ncbi:hypothetical protein EHQ23_08110 [Leptospira bourretii]|uniref:Peptidase C39-like domain-containing protein n=1 Tax=Leptospira bourretii TaxID=2484962 RepID=A0A4R9ISA1_9LEPT|nr:C39 family peptidase [Leptospira bourretii]TGK86211.1 hypothetical protein EHQ23_08110 [Leptospira bourretii]TGK94978.1 hypothetical protein EHQ26_00070 [Leptospira bourretii]TGL42478.1 hypothetical protein EHQ45_02415 [Leptospira bourretii]
MLIDKQIRGAQIKDETGITPGLGITYSPENGWGGSIGLGNTIQNASVSFSQRGNTTVQGSASLTDNIQVTTNITTNGEATVGLNYNAGKGPREGWNLGVNYDLAGSGLSASLGYTHPDSTMGLTSTFNKDGMSTSAEVTGVSIATNGPNGFQMDDLNFAEQNINEAQDKTQKDQNAARLVASGKFSAEQVAKMSDHDFEKALSQLPKETPTDYQAFLGDIGNLIENNINSGVEYAISIGGSVAGGLAFLYGIGSAPSPGSPTPNTPNTQTVVVAAPPNRKKGEEEGNVADHQDPNVGNDREVIEVNANLTREISEIGQIIQNLMDDQMNNSLAENTTQKSNNDSLAEGDFSHLTPGQEFQRKTYLISSLSKLIEGGRVNSQYFLQNYGILSKSLDPNTLKNIQTIVENNYERIKDGSGNLVFSQKQLAIFSQQTSVLINGKLFVREPGTDYFNSDAIFEDNKKHKIKFTQDGKIRQVTTDPKTGIQKTKTLDLKGNVIQPIVAVEEANFLDSNKKFNDRITSVKESPNVQDYKSNPSKKGSLKIMETTSDGKTIPASIGTIEKIGRQLINDAIYEYDPGLNSKGKSKDLLEKFIVDNGLDAKDLTLEQKAVKANLEKTYQDLSTKYTTGIKDKKPIQTEQDKRDYLNDRIDYIKENHNRLTTELLVNRYKDKIDLDNSSEKFTVLKEGGGVILNEVLYDSQNDNETDLMFGKYNLRPGNQCSPTSVAMVMDYLGAVGMHDRVQLVDDIITEGIKAGIIKDGMELQNIAQVGKLIKNYGFEQMVIKPDGNPPNTSRTENIKTQINSGKPVVTSGTFNIELGGKDKEGNPIVVKGHVITIVGYDETGWIVHDPFGDANTDYKKGSGKYIHYEYGKWDIGNSANTYTMSIPEETKQ